MWTSQSSKMFNAKIFHQTEERSCHLFYDLSQYYIPTVLYCSNIKLYVNLLCISTQKIKETLSSIPSVLLSYHHSYILVSLNSIVPLWSTEIVSFTDSMLSLRFPAYLSWRLWKQAGSSKPWGNKLWHDTEGRWSVTKIIEMVLKGWR